MSRITPISNARPQCAAGASALAVISLMLFLPAASLADASAVAAPGNAVVGDEATQRHSRSRQYGDGGREAASPRTTTEDRYEALVTSGGRSAASRVTADGGQSASAGSLAVVSDDFWIFYADVQLFNDDDDDGFYHGIDVLFDADTIYEEADVYAVLYLSYEGGPWNEYAVTDTFGIFGATSDDEYVVVTELMSGYPRGNYDLLIDLYDTFDGRLVATLGPEDTSALAYLPLEDFNRDDPDGGDTVVIVDGGGALDRWTVTAGLMYGLAVYLVRRRQRQFASLSDPRPRASRSRRKKPARPAGIPR